MPDKTSDKTKRDASITDNPSGRAVTDAQGNRIWKFVTDSGRFIRDSTSIIRKFLTDDTLTLEESGAGEGQRKGKLSIEESADGDPYNSDGSR